MLHKDAMVGVIVVWYVQLGDSDIRCRTSFDEAIKDYCLYLDSTPKPILWSVECKTRYRSLD